MVINNINSNTINNDKKLFLKNKLNIITLSKKLKENIKSNNGKNNLFNSGWNQSSNYTLTTTHNNENILYRNKFIKCTPLREKIKGDKKHRVILPEIKTPKLSREIKLTDNNEVHLKYKNLSSEKKNTFKKINLANLNDATPSTSTLTNSTKKIICLKEIDKENLTEKKDVFKGGLLTENSSGNNSNIIIPLLSIRRPEILRYGLFENVKNVENNESKNVLNKLFENSNNKIFKYANTISRKEVAKSQEVKHRIDKLQIPNLHKIKIEKGIKATNLIKMLNKNISEYAKKLNKYQINGIEN